MPVGPSRGPAPEEPQPHLASRVFAFADRRLDPTGVPMARVMGRQYGEAVGPWHRYLRIVASVQGT